LTFHTFDIIVYILYVTCIIIYYLLLYHILIVPDNIAQLYYWPTIWYE